MNRMLPLAVVLAAVSPGLSVGRAMAGDVSVDIHIGTPPPVVVTAPVIVTPPVVVAEPVVMSPPVVTAPPWVVVVPGTRVYHVPNASHNLFVFRGRYYSLHNDAWFVSVNVGAPWRVVAIEAVPAPVRAVPVAYYKIPPGHAKKMKIAEGHRGRKGCPPGHAKHGRC